LTTAPDHAGATARDADCTPRPSTRRRAAPARSRGTPMRKHIIRDAFPDKAMDFAGRIGDGLRHAMPDGLVRNGAGKWLQAGVALGAARTGMRAAGTVARRHPVALTAAAIGIGAALYAVARHRRKKAEQEALQGRSHRIRAALDRGRGRAPHAADLGVGAGRAAD